MVETSVGRLAGLFRYPVKSMAPEVLEAADLAWNGLTGDRRWAFIRPGMERSNFPWLTIRERPVLARYAATLETPGEPESSRTMVRTPEGAELEVSDPALAAELGDGVRVIRQNRGVFDTMPLALITTQTLAALSGLSGRALEARRFRPNLLIDATTGVEFPEDAWVGAVLRIGAVRMRVDQRDARCVMVNLDPLTGESDPAVLKAIASHRQARLGVYGSTVTPGRVALGDEVFVER